MYHWPINCLIYIDYIVIRSGLYCVTLDALLASESMRTFGFSILVLNLSLGERNDVSNPDAGMV